MKIGDTFTDGNRKFECIGFASGYPVSKFIGFTKEDVKPEDTKEEITAEPVKDGYEDMQYSELKKLCAKKGISAKGSKQDLIDRLRG